MHNKFLFLTIIDVEFYKNQMQYLQSQITKVSQDVTEQLTLLKKKEVEIRQEVVYVKNI